MTNPPHTPIHPVSRDGSLPLSFAQERFWFLDQLEPGNSAYLMTRSLHLTGPLDKTALEQSLNAIVARHESLRTTFPFVDNHPVQHITLTLRLSLPLIDLQGIPRSDQKKIIQDRIHHDTSVPVDLAVGPLIRTTLIQVAPNEHVWLLTVHHIIWDGWSRGVFFRELSLCYNATLNGETPVFLPPSPVQYVDFAVWQRHLMQGDRLEKELNYWKSRLSGASILKLLTDRPRPPLQSYNGALLSFSLQKPLVQNLKTLSQRSRCTLFMTLMTAFQILLHRHADQDDIVVGSPIASRHPKELENSIGLFINTLIFRSTLSGNPTFDDVLQQVRKDALGAYNHDIIPFNELISNLKIERSPSYPPIFQVLFVFQNLPKNHLNLLNVAVKPYDIPPGRAMFDIALSMTEEAEQLKGNVRYNSDLFHHETISRMFHRFTILLEGIISNPQRPIQDLSFLFDSEREEILTAWSTSKKTLPTDVNVLELFERQVHQTPRAIALSFDDTELSYEELNTKANQLAHVLHKHGVTPEVCVGLFLNRSPEMIIGLWGILKSGGTYVPLDPDYPPQRLQFILKDANIPLVVTQPSLNTRLPASEELILVNLDSTWTIINDEDPSNFSQEIRPDSLAYILYSSGTTGAPKGIMVSHGALANFVQTASKDFLFTPKDRVLQFASIGFDVSVEEIFPCLTSGSALVLRTKRMLDSWSTFLENCQDWQLTVLDLPTSFLQGLIEGIREENLSLPSNLRLVIIGGDNAHPQMLGQWSETIGSSVQLVNAYGPTETTVNATYWTCESKKTRPISIGYPIANLQTYILDRNLRPVPIGIPGELCIGGASLARGYLQHPSLTAEKFIPNPFSSQMGTRLYRTGDRVRHLADGSIEFLGRRDHQVKIRGFRIELGEIESVLRQQPDVKSAVVEAREEVPGSRHLVAYVEANPESISMDDLRHHLEQYLPHYMIPVVIMEIRDLPVTSNGKVDRTRLPDPDWGIAKQTFIAPRTQGEELLMKVWQEVLKIEKVGIHDNFFDLGGHSLLATKTIARLRHILKKNIPFRILWEHPTIAQLAKKVDMLLDQVV